MNTSSPYQWLNRSWATPSLRLDLTLLLSLAALIILAGIGLRDPWPADEPRFALIAKQMVDSGQWLLPMRGGELYPDKPPVFMWSIALFYWLLGNLKLAFLLPSALAGLGTLVLVYDLTRRLWDRDIAMRASILLLSCVQFTLQAKTAQIDMLVTFWIWLGVYGLVRHFLIAPSWGWYLGAWFAMGLGIITKGVGFLPIFVLVPVLVLWFRRHHRQFSWQQLAKHSSGLLALLAALALWGIPMLLAVAFADDPAYAAYRDNILFKQTGERYLNAWHHHKPWYYFITSVIPTLWLPLSLMFIPLAKRWWGAIKLGDERIIVLLGYAVLVLCFFSYSPGKRGVYILPALPAFAICAAPFLRDLLQIRWLSYLLSGLVAIASVVLIIGGIALPFIDHHRSEELMLLGGHPELPLLIVGGVGLYLLWRSKLRGGWPNFALFIASAWLSYSLLLYPMLQQARSPRELMQQVAYHIGDQTPLAMVAFKEQFLLQAVNPISHFGYATGHDLQLSRAGRWLADDPSRWLFGAQEVLAKCFNLAQATELWQQHRQDWYLVNSSHWSGQCTIADTPQPVFQGPAPQ